MTSIPASRLVSLSVHIALSPVALRAKSSRTSSAPLSDTETLKICFRFAQKFINIVMSFNESIKFLTSGTLWHELTITRFDMYTYIN